MRHIRLTENRLKNIITQIVRESLEDMNPMWVGDELPLSTKEEEIDASWDAFENTMGDEKGFIPTKLSKPDSWERTAYRWAKEKKENSFDEIDSDYPSDFTYDDEDLYGWNAMQSMNTEDPQFANYMRQSWKGKADKDGNITHNVDWSKMLESITRKLNNKIKNYK